MTNNEDLGALAKAIAERWQVFGNQAQDHQLTCTFKRGREGYGVEKWKISDAETKREYLSGGGGFESIGTIDEADLPEKFELTIRHQTDDASLTKIPRNIPAWLRSLYEAEQLMQLSGSGELKMLSPTLAPPMNAKPKIERPRDVVWVWKDWSRHKLFAAMDERSDDHTAAFLKLDSGEHVEFLWGGWSGLPSVVFPTGDPMLFIEAQPFQRRELVGRLYQFDGRNHISCEPPIGEFTLATEPD